MNRSFLVGNFLSGRESVFKHSQPGRALAGVGPARREEASSERIVKLRHRRGAYLVRVQVSLAGALLLLLAVFNLNYRPTAEFMIAAQEQEAVVMEEIEQTLQIEKPPPPPRPPVPIEVPNDELLEEEAIALDAEIDFDAPLIVPPPPPAPTDEAEPEIFVVVEDMPEIVGGMSSLYKALKYPEVARLAGIEGNVVVRLVIDETGTPSDPKVLRSAGQILNDAAIEALLKQRFTPGRQRGRPVKVQMSFPVRFRLG